MTILGKYSRVDVGIMSQLRTYIVAIFLEMDS